MPTPWICIRNIDIGAERFFDTVDEAMEHMIIEDSGPESSPRFMVHEADVEFVDRKNAEASTVRGMWQIGQKRRAASRIAIYGAGLLAAGFLVWQGAMAANKGIECRIEQGLIEGKTR